MKPTPHGRVMFAYFFMVLWAAAPAAQVELWLTSPDESARFERQRSALIFDNHPPIEPRIQVDETKTFQSIDGFGFCLTGGSATHLMGMTVPARTGLLKQLF